MSEGSRRSERVVGTNRRARHDYQILETIEAGIVLTGTEVKSLRAARLNLGDAYAYYKHGAFYLARLHINPYDQGNRENHEPMRERKLLLHAREIAKLKAKVEQKGLTIVPIRVYFSGPYAKVELALARGKRTVDRRQDIAKRDAEREVRRSMRRGDA